MKLQEGVEVVPGAAGEIRTAVIRPAGDGVWPGLLLYTDIFQLTESTLRTARRFAAQGFVVAVPEIYPRGELAGVAREFADEGKARGLAGAAAMPTAAFDEDRDAVVGWLAARADVREVCVTGFCIGGHLAFRAAFDERVAATVCFYPTGLQDGKLGADTADSLQRAGDVRGRLAVVFGSNDPHVPPQARLTVVSALYAAGLEHVELHVYQGGEHAFMRDVGARFDPVLTDLGIAEAVSFFTGR